MTIEEAQKLARFVSVLETPLSHRLNWLNNDFPGFEWKKNEAWYGSPELTTIAVAPKQATPIDDGGPAYPYEMMTKPGPACFKIPYGARIEAVCAEESSRFAIHGVLCDGENKRLVAADARTLVVLPVPNMPDGQATAIMPVKALECYRQFAPDAYLKVTADTTIVIAIGTSCSFGNVKGKFPSTPDVLEKPFGESVDVALAIDVSRLKAVADAFGCHRVHIGMKVNPNGQVAGPVVIVPLMDDGYGTPASQAVLMSVNIKNQKTGLPSCKKKAIDEAREA